MCMLYIYGVYVYFLSSYSYVVRSAILLVVLIQIGTRSNAEGEMIERLKFLWLQSSGVNHYCRPLALFVAIALGAGP